MKTIAKECHISTRTVQRALNDLEEAGFVKRENRFHEMGGQRSNMYYLQIEEINALENLDEDKLSIQVMVKDKALEEIDLVGGDKKVSISRMHLDYLEMVESIDFSIFTGKKHGKNTNDTGAVST